MRGWDNLASIVTKRTYARPMTTGFKEEWANIVDRSIGGNVRGHNVSEDEIKRLRYFMMNRKSLPAGRGLWFSGAPAHEVLGGAALNNCFAGDERFITRQGPRKFIDCVGQKIDVLCIDGRWRPATVKHFGRQKLQKVTFRPGKRSARRVIHYVTPDHRWITQRGETTELCVGDSVKGHACRGYGGDEYDQGFIHGLIFGDGTQHPKYQNRFMIRLCGKKDQYRDLLVKSSIFRSETSVIHEPFITVVTDTNLKDFPDDRSSVDYRAGFLAGWMSTDGSTRNRLSSQNTHAQSWLDKNAAACGWLVVGVTTDDRVTNYGPRKYPCKTFTLAKEKVFYVVDIGPSTIEDVYCVVEPETKTFTLGSGLVTGNCWFLSGDQWENFVVAQDLLMLGGGVGMSVEHRFVSKLPHVKRGVEIVHKPTKDADFIVPDSREGWCKLLFYVLESFFVTGRSGSYSTICVRGKDEAIKGFGGRASGPVPLVNFIEKITKILKAREGQHLRPIDAMDLLCCTGEMVVSGNVRRSAIIIIGDPWDRTYLTSKRWDLGQVPNHRAFANCSVACHDAEDLHPSFWKTFEAGEPFGIVNRRSIQRYGRMGERLADTAIGVNPCAEATLESNEPCNLQEILLPRLASVEEFIEGAVLMHRWGKRVCRENYHYDQINEVVRRNARVGTGITGCLQSSLFQPEILDRVYQAIQRENTKSSREYELPPSIRTTVVKPSGTLSIVCDCSPGIHPTYAPYYIRRVRFASSDPLIPLLAEAGHPIEPVLRFDGSHDMNTSVVEFYKKSPPGTPTAEDFSTWDQLDTLMMAQKHWADQAVSVTVYYERHDVPKLKEWVRDNLKQIKTVSFLCKSDHGFAQAPLEAISHEAYKRSTRNLKPVDTSSIRDSTLLEDLECDGGSCPTR